MTEFTKSTSEHNDTVATVPPRRLGPYYLIEPIGKGGMGVVYKAVHVHLKKLVAIKIISPDRLSGTQSVMRFQRELRALGGMEHPNVVRALDADRDGDVLYLSMEYVPGSDLATILRRRGQFELVDACSIACQVAEGMSYLFEKGLIHRDIKPSNLLLSTRGVVKILDLGLAQILTEVDSADQITKTGQIIGTPDYIAPELSSGSSQADVRSDIYSLGCTLYAMLSGSAPFRSVEGFYGKIRAHAESTPNSLSETRSDIPKDFETVLSRMLAKDPKKRIMDPDEVRRSLAAWSHPREHLGRLAEGFPTSIEEMPQELLDRVGYVETLESEAKPPSPQSEVTTQFSKPKKSSMVYWFVAALGLIVAGGIAAFLLIPPIRSEPKAEPWKPKPMHMPALGQRTAWEYVHEQGLLRVTSPNDLVFMEYGEIAPSEGTYTISAKFHQDGFWRGRVGLYFGCVSTLDNPMFEYRTRVVEIGPKELDRWTGDYGALHHTYGALRHKRWHLTNEGGAVHFFPYPGALDLQKKAPANQLAPHKLSLTLSEEGIVFATWDGLVLTDIMLPKSQFLEPQLPPFHGKFGVFCSDVTVQVSEFTIQKRKKNDGR